MNKIYKHIFDKSRGICCVVSEIAKGHSKTGGTSKKLGAKKYIPSVGVAAIFSLLLALPIPWALATPGAARGYTYSYCGKAIAPSSYEGNILPGDGGLNQLNCSQGINIGGGRGGAGGQAGADNFNGALGANGDGGDAAGIAPSKGGKVGVTLNASTTVNQETKGNDGVDGLDRISSGNPIYHSGSGSGGGGAIYVAAPDLAVAVAGGVQVTGGKGGRGGNASQYLAGSTWGAGGGGGNGLTFATSGTLDNYGVISGGAGGNAAYYQHYKIGGGGGGHGVQGRGLVINNHGQINHGKGGVGGHSGEDGAAIYWEGGDTNQLNIFAGSKIDGLIWLRTGKASIADAAGLTSPYALDNNIFLGDNSPVLAQLSFDTKNVDIQYSGTISGQGSIIKQGTKTLTLSGANSYLGDTFINAGNLQIANGDNLGAPNNKLVFDGGKLTITEGASNARQVEVLAAGGEIDTAHQLTQSGDITGAGVLTKSGAGSLVITGNSQTGGVIIKEGELQIGNGSTQGSVQGAIQNDAKLLVNRSDAITLYGLISGAGSLTQAGSGTTTLTQDNSYSGGTHISAGALQLGDGGTAGSVKGDINIASNAALLIQRSDALMLDSAISGDGHLDVNAGSLVLSGNSDNFAGVATVKAQASLMVNQALGNGTSQVTLQGAGTLGGAGALGGAVTVENDANLSPGASDQVGTLTVGGNLTLNERSQLNFRFGQPKVMGGQYNDFVDVKGDLALDGKLNIGITAGRNFDVGIYHIFRHAGNLTDRGVDIGTLPAADFAAKDFLIQTSDYQVNLVNATGVKLNFWDGGQIQTPDSRNDGTVQGGSGTWRAGTAQNARNWTDPQGRVNAAWGNQDFAIFDKASGVVTVDNQDGAIYAAGMQFVVDGYRLKDGTVTLVPTANNELAQISVGSGAPDSANIQANIDTVLAGATGIRKSGAGTLILSAANSYSGNTQIDDGKLQISSSDNLGDANNQLLFNGGALSVGADLVNARQVEVLAAGGEIDTAHQLTQSGDITGAGVLTKSGAGSLVITGNSQTGGVIIKEGELQIGDGSTQGSIQGAIQNDAKLFVNRSDAITLDGLISGAGSLTQAGSGATTLTANNSYSGGTYIEAGTLTWSGNRVSTDVLGRSGTWLKLNQAELSGWVGAGSGAVSGSNMELDAGSIWHMSGAREQNLLGALNLFGGSINSVAPSSAASFAPRHLTVNSLTSKGGTIWLNTWLGDENSPSDRLVIKGGAVNGLTKLGIRNVGGAGAKANGNGILLVEARDHASIAPDAFELLPLPAVGGYRYALYRGALDGSSPDNWYLRSSRVDEQLDLLYPDSAGAPIVASEGSASAPDQYSDHRPSVSAAAAAPLIAVATNRAMLSRFHQRSGAYGLDGSDGVAQSVVGCQQDLAWRCVSQSRAWARYVVDNNQHQGAGYSVKGSAPLGYQQRSQAVQFGSNVWNRAGSRGQSNHVGWYATLGGSNSQLHKSDGSNIGSNRSQAYNLGVYFSRISNSDAWFDAVIQLGQTKVHSWSQDDAELRTSGTSFAAALEAGYPVLKRQGWKIEPHGRLSYQYQKMGDASNGRVNLNFGNSNSLHSELGLKVKHSGAIKNQKYAVNLDVNLGHEAQPNTQTSFSTDTASVVVSRRTKGSFWSLSAGGSLQLNKNLSLYASLGRSLNFDHSDSGSNVALGVRSAW